MFLKCVMTKAPIIRLNIDVKIYFDRLSKWVKVAFKSALKIFNSDKSTENEFEGKNQTHTSLSYVANVL